ncbi:hypothetical protein [Capnocytophaga canis]|uniref:Lipoprotein n=1 Tax=Capnocytophaga canis TaxID=1848903 RepID=A0A0B7ICD1_9FLAO|nr:hypothetical protein [Capnocytophaga canis]CEN47588.1 conserved exported hypothetical protein [Capnocytophaga canis]
MKTKTFKIGTLIALTGLTLISCNKSDKEVETPFENTYLKGEVTQNRTLDASKTYILDGSLIVKDGAVLNIPAGTVIKANKGFDKYILVLQGGKLNIQGTAENPVKMTANAPQGTAKAGYWGGLIINGKARLSGDWTAGVPQGSTEIDSSIPYGGTMDNDNSGTIQYLILEYTGARSNADVEHNGLTLNGVGSGTTVENVYVYECADDGIEFFGGSVSVKNLLCVNTDDDMFDMTQGWNGTLENCYGLWQGDFSSSESDPRGVEADGNLDGANPTHTHQSDFTIKNMTIDLKIAKSTDVAKVMQDVIKVRRGAKATIDNVLVKGTGQVIDLVDLKDGKGGGVATVSFTNSLTTAISGKESNMDADNINSQITIKDSNKGCSTSIFGWTRYNF